MSIDDSVIPTTISFEGYEISVNFYPIQSSYFETIRQKFNTDQTHLVDSVIAPSTEFSNSMSLIRIISPGDLSSFTPFTLQQMENTKITCSVDIFSSAIDYNIESINEKNLKVILSSIVTDVHASLVEGDNFKKLNSNLLENGVIGRIGMSYKNALFSVESKHLGTYSYNPKPYAVCAYYTDNNSNITSSSYQYANAARFANCSCPSMISLSLRLILAFLFILNLLKRTLMMVLLRLRFILTTILLLSLISLLLILVLILASPFMNNI